MPLMFQPSPGQEDRKISVAVNRTVTHAAAKYNQRVIENLCFLQPGNEVAELRGQKRFHDLKLADPIF